VEDPETLGEIMQNPYTPPAAELHGARAGSPGDAEAVRREHLKHEAALRGLGRIYQVFGALSVPMALASCGLAVWSLVGDSLAPSPDDRLPVAILLAATGFIIGAIGALQLWAGGGMRALKRSCRAPAAILGALLLLKIPLGTLMGGATLWALFSPQGVRIFAPDYPAIVAATPHLRPGTHSIVRIIVGVIVGIPLIFIVLPLLFGLGAALIQ